MIRIFHLQPGDIIFVFDEVDGATIAGVVLAHGAFDFRVPFMADQDGFATITAVLGHLDMHLGDQRAGRIEHLQATAGSFLAHSLGHTMGTEDDDDVIRHLVQFFDEDGPTVAQVFHHELVVHHFMAHVDRRAEDFQRTVDDLDCPVDPRAEAARVGEFDLHARLQAYRAFTPRISTSKVRILPASG